MIRAVLLSLALACPCLSQELVSVSDGRIETTKQTVTIETVYQGTSVLGDSIQGGDPSPPVKQPCKILTVNSEAEKVDLWIEDDKRNDVKSRFREIKKHVWFATQAGTYYVFAIDHEGNKHERIKFTIGTEPTPEPEPEPDPDPDPDPVTPTVKNLVVLVVFESGEILAMPPPQREILQSTDFRLWLNAKCWKETGTNQPAYRFFDKDMIFPVTCDTTWCKLMKQPRTAVPWLIVADENKPVFEGPLPKDVAETKALIERLTNGQ